MAVTAARTVVVVVVVIEVVPVGFGGSSVLRRRIRLHLLDSLLRLGIAVTVVPLGLSAPCRRGGRCATTLCGGWKELVDEVVYAGVGHCVCVCVPPQQSLRKGE